MQRERVTHGWRVCAKHIHENLKSCQRSTFLSAPGSPFPALAVVMIWLKWAELGLFTALSQGTWGVCTHFTPLGWSEHWKSNMTSLTLLIFQNAGLGTVESDHRRWRVPFPMASSFSCVLNLLLCPYPFPISSSFSYVFILLLCPQPFPMSSSFSCVLILLLCFHPFPTSLSFSHVLIFFLCPYPFPMSLSLSTVLDPGKDWCPMCSQPSPLGQWGHQPMHSQIHQFWCFLGSFRSWEAPSQGSGSCHPSGAVACGRWLWQFSSWHRALCELFNQSSSWEKQPWRWRCPYCLWNHC